MSKNGMLLAAVGSTFPLKFMIFSPSEKVSLPHCMGIKIRGSRQNIEKEQIQGNIKNSNITAEVLQKLIWSPSQRCGAKCSLLIFATPLTVFGHFSKINENSTFRDMMKNAEF